MLTSTARELFRQLTKLFFPDAVVIFANQSRTPKPNIPLIVLTPGNVKKPQAPIYESVDNELVGNYQTRLGIVIDLFTNGLPVNDDDGNVIAYEDSAADDMMLFSDFLKSDYVVQWCRARDISITVESDVQSLTGVINDTTYEYRSRLEIALYFTSRAVGHAAALKQESIQYPVFGMDDETGETIINGYTDEVPVRRTSTTGGYIDEAVRARKHAVIGNTPQETSIGAVSEELIEKTETGYFEEAEIKEETDNE